MGEGSGSINDGVIEGKISPSFYLFKKFLLCSMHGTGKRFFFSQASRLALEHIHPPIQRVSKGSFPTDIGARA